MGYFFLAPPFLVFDGLVVLVVRAGGLAAPPDATGVLIEMDTVDDGTNEEERSGG